MTTGFPPETAFFFLIFFRAFDCVGSAWSIGVFISATKANDLRLRMIFHPRFYPLHLFFYLNSWERASIFPFEWSMLTKGTTGTIFITSLVWRGPWLGIEPATSLTRSQHYTTRLSRRRCLKQLIVNVFLSHYDYQFSTKSTFVWSCRLSY